jgi:hypothetical protein
MLSQTVRLSARAHVRTMAIKAASVKALVPELKAISEAVDKSGASTFSKVDALI